MKAERLNGRPVELSCGGAWPEELAATFRDAFLPAQASHAEQEQPLAATQSMNGKTFALSSDSVLSPVVWGLRAKAVTCLMSSSILRLEGLERLSC